MNDKSFNLGEAIMTIQRIGFFLEHMLIIQPTPFKKNADAEPSQTVDNLLRNIDSHKMKDNL